MADCISCDKLIECGEDKVTRVMNGGKCEDYVEIQVESRKAPKVCKWCGNEYTNCSRADCCYGCLHKEPLLPRFKQARDYIREKCGLERMGDV